MATAVAVASAARATTRRMTAGPGWRRATLWSNSSSNCLRQTTPLRRLPLGYRFYSTDNDSTTSPPPQSKYPKPTASVLDRYRSRLAAKAKEEGVTDIEELRQTYADKIEALRKKDAVLPPGVTKDGRVGAGEAGEKTTETASVISESGSESASSSASTDSSASSASSASSTTSSTPSTPSSPIPKSSQGARPLSSFLDLDKARTLPVEELTAVWRLRFANDPRSLCAVIPAATYAAMEAAARARPQFVLPVPHEEGAEIHFLQWTFPTDQKSGAASTVLFTQLAEFKVRGEFAQPHTTVTHHTDLAADCGVVLMQGQVADNRGVSADAARFLVMCLQRFYGAWAIPSNSETVGKNGKAQFDEGARTRRMLLQWFAAGDPQFSIERLMEEVEKLG